MTDLTKTHKLDGGIPGVWLALLYPAAVLTPVATAALWGPEPLDFVAELGSAAGLAAGAMLVLEFVTSGRFESTALIRERMGVRYEIWRLSHSIGSTVAFACLVDHAWSRGTYIDVPAVALAATALGLVAAVSLLDIHFIRSTRVLGSQWRVETVRRLGPKLWELLLRQEAGRPFTFRAGQFAWACFHRQPAFCDHPFSIASAPEELPGLRFVIRESGDFTNGIGRLPHGTMATLDGPHGNLVDWDHTASAVVLIAGGVGIAPIIGILRSLASSRDQRPVRLVVATRTADEQIFAEEISTLGSQLDLKSVTIVEVPAPSWTGHVGRLEEEALASLLEGLDRKRVIALLCGPQAMMGWAAEALHRLGVPTSRIRYELFDYGTAADASSRRAKRSFQLMLLAIDIGLVAFAMRPLVSGG